MPSVFTETRMYILLSGKYQMIEIGFLLVLFLNYMLHGRGMGGQPKNEGEKIEWVQGLVKDDRCK